MGVQDCTEKAKDVKDGIKWRCYEEWWIYWDCLCWDKIFVETHKNDREAESVCKELTEEAEDIRNYRNVFFYEY